MPKMKMMQTTFIFASQHTTAAPILLVSTSFHNYGSRIHGPGPSKNHPFPLSQPRSVARKTTRSIASRLDIPPWAKHIFIASPLHLQLAPRQILKWILISIQLSPSFSLQRITPTSVDCMVEPTKRLTSKTRSMTTLSQATARPHPTLKKKVSSRTGSVPGPRHLSVLNALKFLKKALVHLSPPVHRTSIQTRKGLSLPHIIPSLMCRDTVGVQLFA